MSELEAKIREALILTDYLEIDSEEERTALRNLACELSNRIKANFGEVPLWFLSNRILWAIEDARITPNLPVV